ncbi:hypothetical protein [Streptomyces sp. NPDC059398]|uniref:hypothetical protein n=1 Tax=Streptomyces sp. NPDC059398 TaxID=3346820 RepID=UPI0036ABB5F0
MTAPEPAERNSHWTVALILVALIVAVGAGGAVYAVMDDSGPQPPAPHPTTGSGTPAGNGSPAAPDVFPGTREGPSPGGYGPAVWPNSLRVAGP